MKSALCVPLDNPAQSYGRRTYLFFVGSTKSALEHYGAQYKTGKAKADLEKMMGVEMPSEIDFSAYKASKRGEPIAETKSNESASDHDTLAKDNPQDSFEEVNLENGNTVDDATKLLNERTKGRKYGWSPRVTPCCVRLPGRWSQQWSILPAYCEDSVQMSTDVEREDKDEVLSSKAKPAASDPAVSIHQMKGALHGFTVRHICRRDMLRRKSEQLKGMPVLEVRTPTMKKIVLPFKQRLKPGNGNFCTIIHAIPRMIARINKSAHAALNATSAATNLEKLSMSE
ncbi:hypothetical protein LTR06_011439 [Exophiala xenobiotica]|nr:hypothetical protein LTR06_011439 [Exophiala xenobiotica]